MNSASQPKYVELLREFSIPLLLGVVVAIIVANLDYQLYDKLVNKTYALITGEEFFKHGSHGDSEQGDTTAQAHEDHAPTDESASENSETKSSVKGGQEHSALAWQHFATLHFIINDLFMVIFFGIATKEITESCLPGGALNPLAKAVNPLLGTVGGVLGPIAVYFTLNTIIGDAAWTKGWGIPTATDIALAWLVARMVFGKGHPAISFLLLLAVADDGIGLGIIAFAYPDPLHPTEWMNALWIVPGMGCAYVFRRLHVRHWIPYVLVGGGFSWWGLYNAHLHPALALVPIIPFLPGPKRDIGMFTEETNSVKEQNPLSHFEQDLKRLVDFGLFFFAFVNAGVQFSNINNLTWIVLLSLLIGKSVGITLFSYVASLIGFPLPTGMQFKHLVVAGIVAGLGLTVALFVAGEAFKVNMELQGAAKMGALFSSVASIFAFALGRVLGVKGKRTAGH